MTAFRNSHVVDGLRLGESCFQGLWVAQMASSLGFLHIPGISGMEFHNIRDSTDTTPKNTALLEPELLILQFSRTSAGGGNWMTGSASCHTDTARSIRGTFLTGCPHNKDDSILGSIVGI